MADMEGMVDMEDMVTDTDAMVIMAGMDILVKGKNQCKCFKRSSSYLTTSNFIFEITQFEYFSHITKRRWWIVLK